MHSFLLKSVEKYVKCYRAYKSIIHNTENSFMYFLKWNKSHNVSQCSFCGNQLFQRLDFKWGLSPGIFEDQWPTVRNRRVLSEWVALVIFDPTLKGESPWHSPVPAEEKTALNLYFITESFTFKNLFWLHVSQLCLAFSTLQCTWEIKTSF